MTPVRFIIVENVNHKMLAGVKYAYQDTFCLLENVSFVIIRVEVAITQLHLCMEIPQLIRRLPVNC